MGRGIADTAVGCSMTGPQNRSELAARLREKSTEIEREIFTRVRDLSEPIGDHDPAYVDGLQSAITDAVNCGIECMERGEEWCVPMPPETAKQARRAARKGVRLDTVLRRYAAGNKLLEEFIVAEAEGMPTMALRQILRDQGPQVDRLMGSVAAEYRDELERTRRSSVEKFAHYVLRLLSGDDLEGPTDIDYDFNMWHIGMILMGRKAEVAARLLAERLGYRSLHMERDDETTWAWLGSPQQPAVAKLTRSLSDNMPAGISLAVGEPRRGLAGWRLSHREAQLALQVMLKKPRRFTRGRDVILLAGILRDDTLVRALLDNYLAPLEEQGNSGQILRETLRAYFFADGNAAAAAADLGVTRHTVQRRIRTVEQKIGQLLHTCHAELQVALQLDELIG